MKKITDIGKLLKDTEFSTKVMIFMSSKIAGDDFDPYEENYKFVNLNPITIKAYVREVTPETAFWKQYGLHQSGMKEIITEDKYRSYFELCNKIQIDQDIYQVFKAGTGSRVMITSRPYHLLRVVVSLLD